MRALDLQIYLDRRVRYPEGVQNPWFAPSSGPGGTEYATAVPFPSDTLIGPVPNKISLQSNGDRTGLSIFFSIVKTIDGTPNQSNITIRNLSKENRNHIRRKGGHIELGVGYDGQSLPLLSSGGLLISKSTRNDADINTELIFLDGRDSLVNTYIGATYSGTDGGGTKISAAVQDIASQLSDQFNDLTINEENIKIAEWKKITGKAVTLVGNGYATLSALAKAHDFSFRVDNGVFYAEDDDYQSPKIFTVSTVKRNLINAEPSVFSGTGQRLGVTVEALLDPACRPGMTLQLLSTLDPGVDGLYKIHTVTYIGDSHMPNAWTMNISASNVSVPGPIR